jgi:arginyl-tRNA synthetase
MRESLKANPKKAAPLGDSDESAAAIGISALLAQELLAKRATDRPFAIDKMTSFGRGTGPELRHWHARLCSILRAESSDLTALSDEDFAPIEEEKYTELLRMLAQYPDITNSAYKALEPPTVMLYLVSVTDQLSICLEAEEGQEESSHTSAEAALFESMRQVLLGITSVTRRVPISLLMVLSC